MVADATTPFDDWPAVLSERGLMAVETCPADIRIGPDRGIQNGLGDKRLPVQQSRCQMRFAENATGATKSLGGGRLSSRISRALESPVQR